ncbi:hypothetical protein LSO12E_90022 [Candidatus Liberibacter solanacearum]
MNKVLLNNNIIKTLYNTVNPNQDNIDLSLFSLYYSVLLSHYH